MKKLSFDYYMQIDYSVPVSKCNYTIKCMPQSNLRQNIEKTVVDMYPKSVYSIGLDGPGNTQLYGVNEEEHSTFYYHLSGVATTGLSDCDEAEDDSKSMIYRHPHGLNVAGKNIIDFYNTINAEASEASNSIQRATLFMHRLHSAFEYKSNSTAINTTAEDAWTQGYGVCQDYAHILIALLHLEGIAARYVTGLIVGEGASHAWVEVLSEGYWYGLDPTNDVQVKDEHIKIGVGRDAADCMINRGIMHGGGLHTQKISVNVKEI